MNDRTGGIWDELPLPPDESPGDLVPPIDLWMEGEIGSKSLSDEDQREARLSLAGEDSSVQQPLGAEASVRFVPGDRFAGWDRQSLIDRLVLSPKAGSIDLSPAIGPVELLIWNDDDEVDVVRERGGRPLPADVEVQDHPIVTMSTEGNPEWAVLYESRPWLLSMLAGRPDCLRPIPTNPMGEESDLRRTYEAWAWVIEMTLAWAASGQAGDLEITSLLLQEEEDSQNMEPFVSQAAQGGIGAVRLNREVVYDGGSPR